MTDTTNETQAEEWVVFKRQGIYDSLPEFECGTLVSETEKQIKVKARYASTVRKADIICRGLTETEANKAFSTAKAYRDRYSQSCSNAKATYQKAMDQLETELRITKYPEERGE